MARSPPAPIHAAGPWQGREPIGAGRAGRFTSLTCRPRRRNSRRAARTPGAEGFRTLLSVPLMRDGVAIGAVTLRRTEAHLFTEQADRPARDLRRPGGDRHRERAAVQGAGGPQRRADRRARAADGDQRDPADHQPLADGYCSRCSTPSLENAARLCSRGRRRGLFRCDGAMYHPMALRVPDRAYRDRISVPLLAGPSDPASVASPIDERPVHIPDVLDDDAYPRRRSDSTRCRRMGARTSLAVPMLKDGEPSARS